MNYIRIPKQSLYVVNDVICSKPTKLNLVKCEYYTRPAKIIQFKRTWNDTHLINYWVINKIIKRTVIMFIIVVINENFVAIKESLK